MALNFPNLGAAIGVAEGFGPPGNIPTIANNPGDLVYGSFAISHGAIGAIPAANGQLIARFPDLSTGQAAQDSLISNNYAGGTINDLASGWLSGSSDAAKAAWASTVAGRLGVTPDTPVLSAEAGKTPVTGAGPITGIPALDGAIGAYNVYKAATGDPGGGFTWGRIGAFLLGLIFIAAALYMFKPVQEAVNNTVRVGMKAGAAGI